MGRIAWTQTTGAITLVALSILCHPHVSRAGEIPIVNEEQQISELSKHDLRRVLLGKMTQWPTGERVIVAVLKGGALHDAFVKKYAGKTAKQFTNYWRKMVFSGKGRMPQSFTTASELATFVANNAGAIGYTSAVLPAKGIKELEVVQ